MAQYGKARYGEVALGKARYGKDGRSKLFNKWLTTANFSFIEDDWIQEICVIDASQTTATRNLERNPPSNLETRPR